MPFTFFGNKRLKAEEKQRHVDAVFDTVAEKYDLMNDLSSFFLQRLWKANMLSFLPHSLSKKSSILDLASGTGDIAGRLLQKGYSDVTVCDINLSMLNQAASLPQFEHSPFICANAENLPFTPYAFDVCTLAFGLRNMTHLQVVLSEIYRVLKPGGIFICLEFSKVTWPMFSYASQIYKHKIVPKLGALLVGESEPYTYLAQSIDQFLTQEELLHMMQACQFSQADYTNLLGGLVAIHKGYKV